MLPLTDEYQRIRPHGVGQCLQIHQHTPADHTPARFVRPKSAAKISDINNNNNNSHDNVNGAVIMTKVIVVHLMNVD